MIDDPATGFTADLARRLREVLDRTGYAAANDGPLASSRARALSALRHLFLLGEPVDEQSAGAAVAPRSVDEFASAGVLRRRDGLVSATISLTSIDGMLVAGDRDFARPDCVPGVNPAAVLLANLTPRSPAGTALDLGTGCGVQALLASRHCDHVIGIDVNPRALLFARFNAALNDIRNVEWVLGSWFEPVRDGRFDLVVANPPFVISPELTYVFRDGGPEADALCRSLVSSVSGHLVVGGSAVVLCNWITTPGSSWARAPATWVADAPCDAVLLLYVTEDANSYARRWNRSMRAVDSAAPHTSAWQWTEHYRHRGIEAVSSGAVVLRRRPEGSGRSHAVAPADPPDGPGGEQVERMLSAVAGMAELETDDALLDEVFELVDAHRLDESLTYANGRYVAAPMVMRIVPGIGVSGVVDPGIARVVLACDGRRKLRELVDEAGRSTGGGAADLSKRAAVTFAQLYRHGLVDRRCAATGRS